MLELLHPLPAAGHSAAMMRYPDRGGVAGGVGRESRADVSLGYAQPLDILFFGDEKYDLVRITSYHYDSVSNG